MKKLQDILFSSALVVAAGAGMASCSSSDDIAEAPVNPSFDGENVKTQFAINIATPSSKNQTRMTGENTQISGTNFLGMQNIYLLPLTMETPVNINDNTAISSIIPLEKIESNSSSMNINGSNDYKVYDDVNVPVGTNNFLFYGEGNKGTNMTSYFQKGNLVSNVNGKTLVGSISFQPVEIASTSSYQDVRVAFVTFLNRILNANYTDTSSDPSNTTNWNNLADDVDGDLKLLKETYNNFVKLKAGSAASILASVQSLYNIVKPISENTSSNAQNLAGEIVKAIIPKDTDDSTIKVQVNSSESDYTLSYNISESKYTKFPEEQGLPQGAMVLNYDNTSKEFSYEVDNPLIGTNTNNYVSVKDIVYPTCLTYFVNTPLKATNDINVTWPTTASNWDSDNWTGWGDKVLPSTRSIALQNTINYGVASLKTTIKAKSSTGTLEDNQSGIYPSLNNQEISIGEGFTVTGILIGGQPSSVDWEFLPQTTASFTKTVFDRDMPSDDSGKNKIIAKNYSNDTDTSEPFYTLLLDNLKKGEGSTQEDVYFAIELVNTSNVDFYGVDGVVPVGHKFYLVGKMTLDSNNNVTFPSDSDYRFPGKNIQRIFIQDYTTILNVSFKSLKNAYVTIPDLRASNLQLGLSVDLSWQTGIKYDVTID